VHERGVQVPALRSSPFGPGRQGLPCDPQQMPPHDPAASAAVPLCSMQRKGTARAPPTDRSTCCEMSAVHIWYPRRTSSAQIVRRVCQHQHSERANLYLRRPFMPRPCRRRVYQLALLWFARSDEAERVRQRREEMRRGLPTVERWGGLASWREGVPARDQASSDDAGPGDVGKNA